MVGYDLFNLKRGFAHDAAILFSFCLMSIDCLDFVLNKFGFGFERKFGGDGVKLAVNEVVWLVSLAGWES